jgi:hypothetical protein
MTFGPSEHAINCLISLDECWSNVNAQNVTEVQTNDHIITYSLILTIIDSKVMSDYIGLTEIGQTSSLFDLIVGIELAPCNIVGNFCPF